MEVAGDWRSREAGAHGLVSLWFTVRAGSVCSETHRGPCAVYSQFLPVQVTQGHLDYKVPEELQEPLESARPARWDPLEDRDHQGPQVRTFSRNHCFPRARCRRGALGVRLDWDSCCLPSKRGRAVPLHGNQADPPSDEESWAWPFSAHRAWSVRQSCASGDLFIYRSTTGASISRSCGGS